MRLNILWCKICQAVTAWHLKGMTSPTYCCDRCFHDTKGEDTVMRLVEDVDGQVYRVGER
jgi:hypothetical protein